MNKQTIIIKGDFEISGDIPIKMKTKLKYLKLEANFAQCPIAVAGFNSEESK